MDESPRPSIRVSFVEDHELTLRGFAQMIEEADGFELAANVKTVEELFAADLKADIVVLDLRLADGSSPEDNVRSLRAHNARVLVLTAGEDAQLIRSAARGGALGMMRKSESVPALLGAIRLAAGGNTVASTDWAAALDADEDLADARLSTREREILALYASGKTTQSVAFDTGLSPNTVSDYVSRIRTKYEKAGRVAHSRIDLYRRAEEDGLLGPAV
jgi:two-component system response regulator DevR